QQREPIDAVVGEEPLVFCGERGQEEPGSHRREGDRSPALPERTRLLPQQHAVAITDLSTLEPALLQRRFGAADVPPPVVPAGDAQHTERERGEPPRPPAAPRGHGRTSTVSASV